jgi:endonuclease/exonuclease/phosphatase family metal-dependent hydrolase
LQKHAQAVTDSFSIIGGDLNMRPVEVSKLTFKNLVMGTCQKPTAGARRRNKKLDYIILLPGQIRKFSFTTLRVEGSAGYSDHSPLFGNILPLKK